jgi:hypothetical protein
LFSYSLIPHLACSPFTLFYHVIQGLTTTVLSPPAWQIEQKKSSILAFFFSSLHRFQNSTIFDLVINLSSNYRLLLFSYSLIPHLACSPFTLFYHLTARLANRTEKKFHLGIFLFFSTSFSKQHHGEFH